MYTYSVDISIQYKKYIHKVTVKQKAFQAGQTLFPWLEIGLWGETCT